MLSSSSQLNYHITSCTSTDDQGSLGVEDVTHLPSNFIQAVMLLTSICDLKLGPHLSGTALHWI